MTQNSQKPQDKDSDSDIFELDLLGLLRAVLKRMKLCVAITGTAIVAALLYCFMTTPIYLANCRMLVESGNLKVTSIQEVYDSQAGRDTNSRRDFLTTQMKLMTSDHILARVFEHFEFAKKPEFQDVREPLLALSKRFEVKQVPNTSLIDIGFKDKDPRFSAEVSNYIAQEYINDSRIRSTGFSERGLEKLRDELVNMEATRFKAIEKLNTFKAKHDMLSAETATNLLISRLTELGKSLVGAKEAVANAQASVDAIETWKAQGLRLDSIPEASLNPTLTNFKMARLQAQAALVKTLQDYGPNHRAVTTQKQVIEEMDKAILDETENTLISIRAKLEAAEIRLRLLTEENDAATAELKALDRISDEYKMLEDNLKSAEKAYQYVLDRVSELQIAKNADAGSGGTFQIIVPATPPAKAAYPQKAKVMIIVTLAAGVLSVLLCIVLELLDVTLKGREEFENNSKLPVFGEIPLSQKKDRVDYVCYDEPNGESAEAFRALRTSLSLSPAARRAKLIAVTSSMPSEGKSFVSLNLAITYARSGKRVLLIDSDMRRSRLTRLILGDKKNADGLSTILAGTTQLADLDKIVTKPFDDLNLSFLSSGPIPANPVELLSAETTKGVFEALESQFDMVIVDTAPVLLVSDTVNLSVISNLRFLIVGQLFKTEKKQLVATVEALHRVNANLIGTVIQQSAKSKKAYGYGYGYSYRYGYGSEAESKPWYRSLFK